MKKSLYYCVVVILFIFIFSGCVKQDDLITTETVTPVIVSIEILNEEGDHLVKDNSGWVQLDPKCLIEVKYEGTVNKVEYYYAPTGSDATAVLIGTVDIETDKNEQAVASLCWEPYKGFLGHVWVVLWNGELCVQSEITKAILTEI